jgi:ketosteroid isomerase-like protein
MKEEPMFEWPETGEWPAETDGTEVVPIAREFLEAVERMDKETTVACMHEDVVCEYPTRSIGVPERLEGRQAFAEYEELSWAVPSREFSDLRVWSLGDPSWCLVEHRLHHTFPWPDGDFKTAISLIFGAREGKIVYFREYFDTAALERALANAPAKFKEAGAAK